MSIQTLTHKEHVTSIFVIAWYYWLCGDKVASENFLNFAVYVAERPPGGSA